MRKFSAILVVLLLVFLMPITTALGNENIKVYVDGKLVDFPDQKPLYHK